MVEHKQQNGFTLIEAVVTTAIVSLMSVLVIAGTSEARERLQVRNAAQQFASGLREAILMTRNGVNASGCFEDKRACSSYQVFVPAGGSSYERKVSVTNASTGAVSTYGASTFYLPAGTMFLAGVGDSTANISFLFPSVNVSVTGFTVVSKNNPDNVKMNVCVAPDGAVNVKSGDC